ncbi:cob(I)yrinic acid a,c-diamide adenosyltransferase [bacterium]|uniref:Cob(I)yrinic acid a,c-diamide adenosyltransferase n=1 Tax=Candidatus Scatenecus faecavium TaxID=2840915 RepID=A0A9D1FY94_9BACT|nr:cob(I)yrinic acid a,c-diamide adenosyltransferase [bacterium]HIS83666.1 cob(I)yrinic acid a,c-diamide adenosyltransferase [Candidatus Scatenecus faecavium]
MTDFCDNNLINPNWAKHGYIQVYTGNGKGKTTASLGLAMRALGRCWKVLIIMFTKGGDDYGELNSFRNLSPEISKNLTIVQAGLDRIVYEQNKNADDEAEIKKGWELAKKAIQNDEYNLIILDEANIAIDLGLIDLDEVVEVLKNKPEDMEIVLTGRNANEKIIDLAHLVSEIKPIKHYWDTGIAARKGIEY